MVNNVTPGVLVAKRACIRPSKWERKSKAAQEARHAGPPYIPRSSSDKQDRSKGKLEIETETGAPEWRPARNK